MRATVLFQGAAIRGGGTTSNGIIRLSMGVVLVGIRMGGLLVELI
jgi:hypothetical protein